MHPSIERKGEKILIDLTQSCRKKGFQCPDTYLKTHSPPFASASASVSASASAESTFFFCNSALTHVNTWKINRRLDCNSFNVIYIIERNIDKWRKRYIGETRRAIKNRLAGHRGYVVNNYIDKATGAHFTLPGHSLANRTCTILEQVKVKSDFYSKKKKIYNQ